MVSYNKKISFSLACCLLFFFHSCQGESASPWKRSFHLVGLLFLAVPSIWSVVRHYFELCQGQLTEPKWSLERSVSKCRSEFKARHEQNNGLWLSVRFFCFTVWFWCPGDANSLPHTEPNCSVIIDFLLKAWQMKRMGWNWTRQREEGTHMAWKAFYEQD